PPNAPSGGETPDGLLKISVGCTSSPDGVLWSGPIPQGAVMRQRQSGLLGWSLLAVLLTAGGQQSGRGPRAPEPSTPPVARSGRPATQDKAELTRGQEEKPKPDRDQLIKRLGEVKPGNMEWGELVADAVCKYPDVVRPHLVSVMAANRKNDWVTT